MDVITLDAQPRELGSSAARAVRRDGDVPCVLYGPHQEPVHFRVPVLALRPLIYTAETHRVTLELDGESYECITKHIDYHPVTDVPVHADFYALTAGEEITMTVPVAIVGAAPGVKAGGILSQPLNELTVRCLPKDIPSSIEVDISELEIGDSIHVSDIAGEGLAIETDPSRTIVSIMAPTAEPVEEDEAGLLLEGDLPEGEGDGEGEETEGEEPEEG
jgi:large subunit ribosomal protein L25